MLDAEEKRVLRLMVQGRRTGTDYHGDHHDARIVFRLFERKCVRVEVVDEERGCATLTKLGEIAARLP